MASGVARSWSTGWWFRSSAGPGGHAALPDLTYRPGMTEGTPSVLVIGLDPHRVPGPWDPEPVALAVEAAIRELRAAGMHVENCAVGLDGSDDIPAVVGAALTSSPWDCVLVGGGIRKNEDLLELFEQVVNLVHRHAPQALISFNATPDDVPAAVRRVLRSRGLDSP
jgi:hypothetical protein